MSSKSVEYEMCYTSVKSNCSRRSVKQYFIIRKSGKKGLQQASSEGVPEGRRQVSASQQKVK